MTWVVANREVANRLTVNKQGKGGPVIDKNIRDSFPCVDRLLQEMLSDRAGFFRQPVFEKFFASDSTRLRFSEENLEQTVGGESFHPNIDTDGYFRDTVYLNRYFLDKASREYLSSVIIHESLHAYIMWCFISYHRYLNGVDSAYLQIHFPVNWKMLISDHILSNDDQHSVMSEDFIRPLISSLYLYTNHRSGDSLRTAVANALTWGGLCETTAWKGLSVVADTCDFHAIDIWARKLRYSRGSRVDFFVNCRTTYLDFFDSLALRPICQRSP